MYKFFDWKDKINNDELDEVVNILSNNGIVIFPTETVYGIGGNALVDDVVDKIYLSKHRPREKALNIMVASINDIEKYAEITSELERKIINNFLPGPLTIILKRKANFGEHFTAGNDTIGVRIPENEIAKAILEKIDFPLIVPSANISNKPSGVDPKAIIKDFESTVDAIIDGGIIEKAQSSTIVKIIDNEIVVLRQGKITKDDIIKK
jgi:L-threonylcarbamoyladenylate synthase